MEIEPSGPSRGDELIEQIKARRSGQFGTAGLLGAVSAAAVVMAAPRLLGVRYESFFGLAGLILFGCAPLACWTTYLALPRRIGRLRLLAAVLLGLALTVPWIAPMFAHDPRSAWGGLMTISILFWAPQAACIALVRLLLFRQ